MHSFAKAVKKKKNNKYNLVSRENLTKDLLTRENMCTDPCTDLLI